ncbi:MAG TPA: hypothetical protein VEH83_08315 [Gemmatimonadales bacterium]|nr:hypothetical protein [Gemmatimonadales bacterium]
MLRFLHWVGVAVWLGAQMTFMVWGPVTKAAGLEAWAHTWKTLARVQGLLVAPAAAMATITGIVMTMQLVGQHADETTALELMQGFGLVAGVIAVAVVTPLANRVAYYAHLSVEKGAKDPRAEKARVLLAWAGSLTGVAILVALYFGAQAPRMLP